MTIRAYWWDPRRPLRSASGEIAKHGRAWAYLVRRERQLQNFGDVVNSLILPAITGCSVKWAPLPQADVVCIGSVLNAYAAQKADAAILGSGVRDPSTLSATAIQREMVLGVRGLGSAASLGLGGEQAIGDPGLVIGAVVPAAAKKRRPVFVPHFTMPGRVSGRRLISSLAAAGYDVIMPNADPKEVARSISAAPFVVSSSLHALVFADAYGVACARLVPPASSEPAFKYDDYRSTLGPSFAAMTPEQALNSPYATAESMEQREIVAAALPVVLERIHDAARALR